MRFVGTRCLSPGADEALLLSFSSEACRRCGPFKKALGELAPQFRVADARAALPDASALSEAFPALSQLPAALLVPRALFESLGGACESLDVLLPAQQEPLGARPVFLQGAEATPETLLQALRDCARPRVVLDAEF